jgi:hypothetical protein
MNQLTRLWVFLSRLHHSLGFGIQSPTDYAFVRYVVNEHWPYYAYQQLNAMTRDSLKRKLGRLYFRLANWRQPSMMVRDDYEPFWDERGEEEEETLREPLHKVRFSDDYEGMGSSAKKDEDPFLWVDTDSQVMAPKSRQSRKKKAS